MEEQKSTPSALESYLSNTPQAPILDLLPTSTTSQLEGKSANSIWDEIWHKRGSARSMELAHMQCIPVDLGLSVGEIQRKERSWGDWPSCNSVPDQQELSVLYSISAFDCCNNEICNAKSEVRQTVWPAESIWSLALTLTAWTVHCKLCETTIEICTAERQASTPTQTQAASAQWSPSPLTQPPAAEERVC